MRNSQNTEERISIDIEIFKDSSNLSLYMIDTLLTYCVENTLLTEGIWEFIDPSNIYWNWDRAKESFARTIRNRIHKRLEEFFKNGLHLHHEYDWFELSLLIPRDLSLKKIETWELLWVLRFWIKTNLKPRYLKDGDAWLYELFFEIEISEMPLNLQVSSLNSAILRAWNRSYKVAFIYPNKTNPKTTIRDWSIERSREAYRTALMRVVRSWSFSKK